MHAQSPFRSGFSVSALALLCLTLASCAGAPRFEAVDKKDGLASTSGDEQTIVIMGLNDVHGALLPREMKSKEPEDRAPEIGRAHV